MQALRLRGACQKRGSLWLARGLVSPGRFGPRTHQRGSGSPCNAGDERGPVQDLVRVDDFGNGWERMIKVERIAPGDPTVTYPRLVEGVGRCPPEDFGGP